MKSEEKAEFPIKMKGNRTRDESGICIGVGEHGSRDPGFYIPYSILKCTHQLKGAKGFSHMMDLTGEGTKFVEDIKNGKYDDKKQKPVVVWEELSTLDVNWSDEWERKYCLTNRGIKVAKSRWRKLRMPKVERDAVMYLLMPESHKTLFDIVLELGIGSVAEYKVVKSLVGKGILKELANR